MQYRPLGSTGMQISIVALGGLLARYEGFHGHPPPEEKKRIYLRADELGVNLFDMGYGDEVHIPDELKGHSDDRYFALKVGLPDPDTLEEVVDRHIANLRRDAIDILRVHHRAYLDGDRVAETIATLRQKGKIRSLCLIRHFRAEQELYAALGPEAEVEADLVIYNYVCRWQAPGIELSADAGKGVLIMKALGGQWISWEDKTGTSWPHVPKEELVQYAPNGKKLRRDTDFIYDLCVGSWHELAEPGESRPRTSAAMRWVLENPGVSGILLAVASAEELDEAVGI